MTECPECNKYKLYTVQQCAACGFRGYPNENKIILTFKEFKKSMLVVDTYTRDISKRPLLIEISQEEIEKIKNYVEKRYNIYDIPGQVDRILSLFEMHIKYQSTPMTFYYFQCADIVIFYQEKCEDKKRMIEFLYTQYLNKVAWEREK